MNPEQCSQRSDGVWVCGDCGFAYDLSPAAVTDRLATAAARVRATVAAIEPARLDVPRRPGVWTPREYLAHLTDWSEIIAERIDRILHEDRPTLRGLDQDLLAVEKAYAGWDVSVALDRYETAVEQARGLVDEAGPANWNRLGVRDDLGEVSLSLIANDLIHELDHHLLDIQGVKVGGKAPPPAPSAPARGPSASRDPRVIAMERGSRQDTTGAMERGDVSRLLPLSAAAWIGIGVGLPRSLAEAADRVEDATDEALAEQH